MPIVRRLALLVITIAVTVATGVRAQMVETSTANSAISGLMETGEAAQTASQPNSRTTKTENNEVVKEGNGARGAHQTTGMNLNVSNAVKQTGASNNKCSASDVGKIRYNAVGNYLEVCSYP